MNDSTKPPVRKPATESDTPLPPFSFGAPSSDQNTGALPRRDFLRIAGAGAGLLLAGGSNVASGEVMPVIRAATSRPSTSSSPDIVVIGAGVWGCFTALNLQKMGAKVTLVDAYGPGNARSTSGDETRRAIVVRRQARSAGRALDAVGA